MHLAAVIRLENMKRRGRSILSLLTVVLIMPQWIGGIFEKSLNSDKLHNSLKEF